MFQGILIIALFIVIAGLMISKKIPTLLALPILALGILLISGVPMKGQNADGQEIGYLQTVFEAGATRMAAAYIAAVFGAWLGQLMNKSGVTENMIKKAAELGGDRPLIITVILSAVVALLFTTLSGLGSVIMVGTIVLPIMVSIGIPALSAAAIYLMSFATGLSFNIANWQNYSNIFGVPLEDIKSFSYIVFVCTALATAVIILREFKANGIKFAFSAPATEMAPRQNEIKGFTGAMAMITPIVPIILVALFKVPVIPSFFVGIFWILIFTYKSWQKSMNMLTKTCYDGISDAAPAIILMVGIGILYLAVTHPMVKDVLAPFMTAINPSSRITYILFFILLSPLALYRGPLNLFGLGSGIAALFISLGLMPVLAVMGAFLSVERMQAVGDPTNTQNVWTANFAGVEVNTLTKKLVPYLWVVTAVCVIAASTLYF